jgi:glutamate-ammonia-ligase adenylyltransferase
MPSDATSNAPSIAASICDPGPLHARISAAPVAQEAERADRALADLTQRCRIEAGLAELGRLIAAPAVRNLLTGILGASPYLTSLIERDPESLERTLAGNPEQRFAELLAEMAAAMDAAGATQDAMRILRRFKAEVALLIGLSDIGGV